MNRLVIIGGGAAGLMAAVSAGEAGLGCMLLERRHRPGLKLLLCGNNRCNLSHDSGAEEMLAAYGEPVASFMRKAILAFQPSDLRRWFGARGLATISRRGRIYPATEDSDDVLHCFLDRLRELQVPLALNCPVASIERLPGGFRVTCANGVALEAENLLLATGGFSYPKTGSVGDGQRFAAGLGHSVAEPRPGLAGMDIGDCPLDAGNESEIRDVVVFISAGGRPCFHTRGNLLCCGSVLRGSAIFDAARAMARRGISSFDLELDICPDMPVEELAASISRGQPTYTLEHAGISRELAGPLAAGLRGRGNARSCAEWLKRMPMPVRGIRPLKEAIVTVGGISLDEVDWATMESRLVPGLYFAGEVLDIDGPTGGYNLHAAFATARLAMASIAGKYGLGRPGRERWPRGADERGRPQGGVSPRERYKDPRAVSRGFGKR